MRPSFVVSVLLIAGAWPLAVSAWGADGHRIVGELAERRLDPAARAALDELLRDAPEHGLAAISTWADGVRGRDDPRRSVTWHYVNFPDDSCDYEPERDCAGGACIVAAIERQTAIVADRGRPPAERVAALKFVVHLVGDVHQPMHAGRRSDRGGNGYQLSLDGQGTNLHRVWDSQILAHRGLPWRDYADRLASGRPAGADEGVAIGSSGPLGVGRREAVLMQQSDGGPADWAMESCRLIDAENLYPDAHLIDASYLEHHRPLAERRLVEAAGRLAALLDAALAP